MDESLEEMSKRKIAVRSEEGLDGLINALHLGTRLGIRSCSKMTAPRDWKRLPRRNHDLHLLGVRSGRGQYIFEDTTVELQAGTVLFVSDGCRHRAVVDRDDPPSFIGVRFERRDRPPLPKGIEAVSFAEREEGEQRHFHAEAPKEAWTIIDSPLLIFERIFEIFISGSELETGIIFDALLCELLWGLRKAIELNGTDRRIDPRLAEAKRILDQKLDDPPSVRELARTAGYSIQHFRARFSSAFGCSPKSYIINSRIKRARAMLRDPDASIKEIAAELGYADQYAFSKQFRGACGIAPTAYRASAVSGDY